MQWQRKGKYIFILNEFNKSTRNTIHVQLELNINYEGGVWVRVLIYVEMYAE